MALPKRCGVTLIELLVVLISLLSAVVVAFYLRGRIGWVGVLLGLPLGFVGALFAIIGLLHLVVLYVSLA